MGKHFEYESDEKAGQHGGNRVPQISGRKATLGNQRTAGKTEEKADTALFSRIDLCGNRRAGEVFNQSSRVQYPRGNAKPEKVF